MTEGTVMARRAPSESIRAAWARQEVFGSLWFLPLCLLVTGLVLSATLIAVQLTSSQFLSRIVRIFVHSMLTKATVGMYPATFVFAVDAMVAIERGSLG